MSVTSTGSESESAQSKSPTSSGLVANPQNGDGTGSNFQLSDSAPQIHDIPSGISTIDPSELADLIANYGNSTSTAWLEKERYRTWRPSPSPTSKSSFPPVQGYLEANGWVFAWGSPIISDRSALKPTAEAFIRWVSSQDLRPVFCCVDVELEEILAGMGWSTVSCINEDVIDPEHVIELTMGGEDVEVNNGTTGMVKDLKKNLRRAERANVQVEEVKREDMGDEVKKELAEGIEAWKKSRSGLQLAATSFDPWLDFEHRRYWVARVDTKAVGIIILTPVQDSYVIKNAVSFPKAPKGTSEALIFTALKDLRDERASGNTDDVDQTDRQADQGQSQSQNNGAAEDSDKAQQEASHRRDSRTGHMSVTFSISAAGDLKPTKNVSGWKFTWLNKTYSNVSQGTGLLNRSDFRSKFDSEREPMFVCYPTEDGFGLDGIETLLKLLRR
ncbi:hypothetical protein BJ138DRAFT_1010655 [Hygrophoropsis aurantiaca]|uniref:Uncharacterized protein n=1 Tax=Hygrophoropsis aurantiaca TaxID=72124 RepID=A0ACB8A7Y0_9AGAM|nr:hypothetical protein BJ138DRAFT_1010655 [Hygrophoropsis aurantiaca]